MIEGFFLGSTLLQSGGLVLALIVVLSTVMWGIILERYWFFRRELPGVISATVGEWQLQIGSNSRVNARLRYGVTSGFHSRLARGLGVIEVIAAILPMLGLLGTVIGMIKTFEVMTIFGSGNVRGMAEGISQALITTMAGLVTALFGMFYASQIQQKITYHTERMREFLQEIGSEDETAHT